MLGGVAYLAAYGARMPLLAFRGLLRTRNLALIVLPATALGAVALALEGRVDGRTAAGALAVALVPAPLVGPEIVGRLRGRADLAGALVLGTVIASLLVVGSRGALAASALFTATEAYAIAAMLAGALPTVRDAVLVPLRVTGLAAVVLVFASAVLVGPPFSLEMVLVAGLLFVAGGISAGLIARAMDRDLRAAVAGAGLRDPALAVCLATITAGPDATGVPLLYAVFCLVLGALALRPR